MSMGHSQIDHLQKEWPDSSAAQGEEAPILRLAAYS